MAPVGVGVHHSVHTSLPQPVRWMLGALVMDSSLTCYVEILTSISLDRSPLTRHSIFCIAKLMLEDTACVLGISPLLLFYTYLI